MAGAEPLIEGLEKAIGSSVRIQRVPCVGRCEQAPVAVVGQHPVGHASTKSVVARVDAGDTGPEYAGRLDTICRICGARRLRGCAAML